LQSIKIKTQKEEAEEVYSGLLDAKTKAFSDQAKLICAALKIEPESIQPGQLQHFVSKLEGDRDLAKIHLKFFNRKRVCLLIKIGEEQIKQERLKT